MKTTFTLEELQEMLRDRYEDLDCELIYSDFDKTVIEAKKEEIDSIFYELSHME